VSYLRSFSIRSTWVMIMRRQQYRFRPSSSIASLHSLDSQQSKARRASLPIGLTGICDQLKVALPEVTSDLQSKLVISAWLIAAEDRTFPQEKQRMGIIILMYYRECAGSADASKRIATRAGGTLHRKLAIVWLCSRTTKIKSSSVIFPTERLSYQQLFSQAGPKFLRTFTQ